uniref:3-oxoacyl-[acyl-carrier-protein] reductase n=1 Tax=Saccoglossus kowalevskii TaxID=10224 RepID=A0ABM0M5G2_SACKO|nr:PREDICTED: dehydrogenase/reductase SDR family member 4-like [Saccoglossus kowalevskii]
MAARKVALITGSSNTGNIGYGISQALARSGYDIIVHGRINEDDADHIKLKIQSEFRVTSHYIKADLRQRSEIENLCKQIQVIYPSGIDVLVNNAASMYAGPLKSHPPEKWDEIIQVNLTAPFDLIRLTIGAMKTKGWGRIINISSAVSKGHPNYAAYSISKGGLEGLTKTAANDAFETGVTCNAICPAVVKTQMSAHAIQTKAEHDKKSYVECEVADLAVFLCSPAADQITGACIPVDAGYWSK